MAPSLKLDRRCFGPPEPPIRLTTPQSRAPPRQSGLRDLRPCYPPISDADVSMAPHQFWVFETQIGPVKM